MANDYYPDFYRRKRQRDHVFVILRNVFLFVFVCALAVALGYLLWRGLIAPRSTEPGATPQLAGEREDLATKQLLSDAGKQNVNSGTVAQESAETQRVDLKALPYAPSFPIVQVGVGGSAPAASTELSAPGTEAGVTPGAEPPEETTPPAANEVTAPAGGDSSESAAESETEEAATKAEEKDAEAAKAEAKKAEQKKADAKKAEQAKLDKKKADDAKKAEQAKKEEQEKTAPPAKSGGFTYRVYAGTSQSREAAEKLKDEVAATGVSATIIQSAGDYLLLVGTLDDFDSAMALRDKLVSSGFSGAFTSRRSK